VKPELERRQTLTDALQSFVVANAGAWLTMRELAEHGGFGGWRTRLSDLRLKRKLHIEWNGKNGSDSRHRYLPYVPIARDASEYTETLPLPLFEGAPR
jgi:hypothetical protein